MKKRIKISLSVLCVLSLLSLGFWSQAKDGFCGGRGYDRSTMITSNTGASSAGGRFGDPLLKIHLSQSNIQLSTNPVCGATSYRWIIDDFTIETTFPNLTISARDFLIMPASGCDDFNKKLIETRFGSTPNSYIYMTKISVSANAGLQNTVTLPVELSGVNKCTDIGSGSGDEKDNWLGGRGPLTTNYGLGDGTGGIGGE